MGPRRERRGEQYSQGTVAPVYRGFNGATARAPWRTHVAHSLEERLASASMGPRRERRGELQKALTPYAATALQWGHGASAVENATLTYLRRKGEALQWGHGA